MMELKLEFMVFEEGSFPKVSAQVASDCLQKSRKTGMPVATCERDAMHEFENELRGLEKQIAAIREQAKRKFIAAGVKV